MSINSCWLQFARICLKLMTVKILMNLVHADELQFVLPCNMKLLNLICGIQAHSSMYPCCWYNISSRDLHQTGSLRTFGSIKNAYNEYVTARKDIETAKYFENTVHQFCSQTLTLTCA